MLKKIAEKMGTKLVLHNEKQKAYVRYGLEIIMMTVMGVTGMIVISIILHMKWAWIPFLISFSMLRSSAGGYHANCAESCFFISEGMFFFSVMIVKFFTIANEVYWVGYMIAWGIILKYAPVEAVNNKLKEELRRKNRTRSIVILAFHGIILWLSQGHWFGALYYMAMMCSVISMLVAIQKEKMGGDSDAESYHKTVSNTGSSCNIDCN